MAAPVVVVQGASRGLGLEFCKQLLRWKTPAVIIATCRHPDACPELQALAAGGTGTLSLLQLDVDREDDVRGAAERVAARCGGGGVDLVINCAAMLHPSGRGETSLRDVSAQVLNESLLLSLYNMRLKASPSQCIHIKINKINTSIKTYKVKINSAEKGEGR